MSAFIENIYPLRVKQAGQHRTPHGPVRRLGEDRLVVADFDGQIFKVTALPEEPRFIEYGEPCPRSPSPDLYSFDIHSSGKQLTARFLFLQERVWRQKLWSPETRSWIPLSAPTPAMDGAPDPDAVLGFWIGDEIVVFYVQPRFGRLSQESLIWSRYDTDGVRWLSLK